MHAALDEPDAAMRWLTQAYEEGFAGTDIVATSPFFASLRADPDFESLMDQARAHRESMRLEIETEERRAGER